MMYVKMKYWYVTKSLAQFNMVRSPVGNADGANWRDGHKMYVSCCDYLGYFGIAWSMFKKRYVAI